MIEIILCGAILGLVTYLFARLRRKGRGSGAAMFMITHGATDAFYDHDKKKAIETIVERNAGKKMEEQSSSGKKKSTDDDPE